MVDTIINSMFVLSGREGSEGQMVEGQPSAPAKRVLACCLCFERYINQQRQLKVVTSNVVDVSVLSVLHFSK